MKPWTDEARRIFEEHGESRRAALLAAGADPDEVVGDWRAHVAEEAERRPEPEVGAALVREILARLDAGAAAAGDPTPGVADPPPAPPPAPSAAEPAGPALTVLATTLVVGGALKLLVPDMPWAVAFVFGAIVSPPDAVAATSILSRVNIPRRIVTVLEGESLVNDASGLVIYKFAIAAVLTGAAKMPSLRVK